MRGGIAFVGLIGVAAAGAFAVVSFLPASERDDPTLAGIAEVTPPWLAVAWVVALYLVPIALSARERRGLADAESPREKAISAAGPYLAPAAAVAGALLDGSVAWAVGGGALGLAGGIVLAAMLRRALDVPPP